MAGVFRVMDGYASAWERVAVGILSPLSPLLLPLMSKILDPIGNFSVGYKESYTLSDIS